LSCRGGKGKGFLRKREKGPLPEPFTESPASRKTQTQRRKGEIFYMKGVDSTGGRGKEKVFFQEGKE